MIRTFSVCFNTGLPTDEETNEVEIAMKSFFAAVDSIVDQTIEKPNRNDSNEFERNCIIEHAKSVHSLSGLHFLSVNASFNGNSVYHEIIPPNGDRKVFKEDF